MKTSILITLFTLFVSTLFAQPQAIRQLAELYPDDEVRSELTLSGSWLKMLTKSKDDTKESNGFLKEVHILTVPATKGMSARSLSGQLERDGYELLTNFRSNRDQGYILIKESKQGITELVAAFTGEENKLTTITVGGLFSLDDLDNMDIEIDGWNNVKKGR